jgi:hypothetical protein
LEKEKPVSINFLRRGTAAGAALALFFGTVAAARAQLHFHVDLGHHSGASVRFGDRRPEVRPVAPVVVPRVEHHEHYEPPGIVRHEHYVAPGYWGHWRNPYRDEYWRRFRPGWFPIVIGDVQYYAYPALPAVCQTVVVNGVAYYLCDGIYYQPYIYQGQTVYMAIPPPVPG